MKVLNIYAVPRSGSSLVQNLIAANLKGYEANPESWLAVQLFGPLKYPTYSFIGMEAAKKYTNTSFSYHLEKNLVQCYDDLLDQTSTTKKIVEKTTRNLYFHELISKSSHDNFNLILFRHPFDIFLSHRSNFCWRSGKSQQFRITDIDINNTNTTFLSNNPGSSRFATAV